MKYVISESQLIKIIEQDLWVRKAASGPQKCGKDAKWCGDNQGVSDGGERVRPEKTMSKRQNKKYSETEYWTNQLLKDVKLVPDYPQRSSEIKSEVGSISGGLSTDDKIKVVINLTDKVNKSKDWWFSGFMKKSLNVPSILTDKDTINFIKSKGGFDQFKDYYLTDVIT
jgi:hypothetical protein